MRHENDPRECSPEIGSAQAGSGGSKGDNRRKEGGLTLMGERSDGGEEGSAVESARLAYTLLELEQLTPHASDRRSLEVAPHARSAAEELMVEQCAAAERPA